MQDGIGNYSNASTEIEALQQQGLHFQKQGAHGSAVAVYQRLLALGQDGPAIRYNLGSALLQLQNPAEALEQFEAGIQLCPQESGLRLGLANAHKLLGNPTAAEDALEQELDLCPDSIPAAVNLGWLLEEQNRVPEALVQYRKAMYYQPNHPILRWNHGLACLMLGDYSRGWRDYEHRWAARQKAKPTDASPEWRGEPLRGRRLLLHSEQGFGDTLMFVRFAQMLSHTEEVHLQCQPQLKRLLSQQTGLASVVGTSDPAPAHDVHAPLMSLPHLMGLNQESELSSPAYLEPVQRSLQPLPNGHRPGIQRVGFVWASAPNSEIADKKSIPLHQFRGLFDTPHCQFYALHMNAKSSEVAELQRHPNVHDLRESIIDFEDTAGYLSQMDLVITVDTAVAHLAGALGKPTWTLLPNAADWRWRMHRSDSPWYPSMRLFRQPSAGDWNRVLEEISHSLFNHSAQLSTRQLACQLQPAAGF